MLFSARCHHRAPRWLRVGGCWHQSSQQHVDDGVLDDSDGSIQLAIASHPHQLIDSLRRLRIYQAAFSSAVEAPRCVELAAASCLLIPGTPALLSSLLPAAISLSRPDSRRQPRAHRKPSALRFGDKRQKAYLLRLPLAADRSLSLVRRSCCARDRRYCAVWSSLFQPWDPTSHPPYLSSHLCEYTHLPSPFLVCTATTVPRLPRRRPATRAGDGPLWRKLPWLLSAAVVPG
ncbi:hypothetical protein BDV95DRAFT_313273 [Massariosphaeria phaeospora]|uniref:Uncharacterized protein n=1 Tax=Massariosphaeria phaeospora TaxID=100035 RepID=A0A7C8MAC9_9PLEO|nr:hypothetical protein BDV95DRAFT_313273 [Massariosphaeria phaeospora]